MSHKYNNVQYKTVGFKPSKRLIILIFVAVFLLAALLGLLYYRSLNRIVFKEPAVYYLDGFDYDIPVGGKVIISSDAPAEIDAGNDFNLIVSELPIYYKEKPAIVTVVPMSFYPANIQGYELGRQIEPLTNLEMVTGSVSVTKRSKRDIRKGGFLFDGDDTYVLLDDGVLHIGEQDLALSALSYVIASYDSYVMYFDYATSTFDYVMIDSEEYQSVYFEFSNGTILNCDLDRVTVGNESFMLTSAITTLPNYF